MLILISISSQVLPISRSNKVILSGAVAIITAGLQAKCYLSFYNHFKGSKTSTSYGNFLNTIFITGKPNTDHPDLPTNFRIQNGILIILPPIFALNSAYKLWQIKKEQHLEKLKNKTTASNISI